MNERLQELAAHRRRTAPGLCNAPLAQLHFDPDGTISVCSKSTHRVVGRVGRDRVLDVWRGAALDAIRAELAMHRFPSGCEVCEWQLRAGNVRSNPLLDFDGIALPADPRWPSRLEFSFSDLCNLGCMHCSPRYSSVLRVRAGQPALPVCYDDAFFRELEPLLEHVRHVGFLGGEPLLQPEVYRLCDMFVERGLQPSVHVTTNGTVWNARVERIFAALPVAVSVSLDAVTARTFERIRVGAKHVQVQRNLQRFAAMARERGQVFCVNFALMRANWHELAAFLRLASELGARPWVTVVTSPSRLSLWALPAPSLRFIRDQLHAEIVADLPETARVKLAELLRLLDTAIEDAGPRTEQQSRERMARAQDHMDRALRRGDASIVERLLPIAPRVSGLAPVYAMLARGEARVALALAALVPPSSPDGAVALVLRAEHALAAGDLDAAEVLLAAAAELPAVPLDLLLRRAWLHVRRSRLVEARADLARLAAANAASSTPAEHLVLGHLAAHCNMCIAAGDLGHALADARELLVREPQNPHHARQIALIEGWLERGDSPPFRATGSG